ncbi:hypothetical protein PN497_20710 [Sphaerospermopsis kisseleviana CS-549]|uniref:Plasmid stabilization system n=1 Tax=Sphaerospermopsis kisseleviana CS-549 TaxID=3021783 RepID=A0ABT4ZYM3_9CYAN|nr:hypothetical protein [Sphaerospermopsis kisseleviana]MDB9443752.1 hypothetical protein [Sphaerospermopsis kisseleviana CS-549]BAZ79689.1 hypothetical protein NIES73_09340 [Sphaerospermopsis kisseleviana NIES-73]
MAYRIEILPTAIADIESIFLWIKEESQERAFRWVRGCYEIILNMYIAFKLRFYFSFICLL